MNVLSKTCPSADDLHHKNGCTFQLVLRLLSGKWKAKIIWSLKDGALRFGELKRKLCGIKEKMLTHELREFEVAGIVERKIFSQIPPKVEYTLTAKGQSLIPFLNDMNAWESFQEHYIETEKS
jgi:DNA-binding HxlR family transcriptional regulator